MESDTLEKILIYIDNHIFEKINLNDLSGTAGYSPFYFSKLFSEAMGMPVTGYIRIRKLQYALVSLLEGKKVLDVAMLYAFDSHEGFTRSFTQLFGSTPSTVRKFLTSYMVPKYVVPVNKKRRIIMKNSQDDLQSNMHQLVFEVSNESLEEARAGFCTKIDIILLPDNRVEIRDNGRGMPLSKDLHASKAVMDKLLAGSPITNLEYSQMGDLVQAGMQTVNSLCETLHITVNRNDSKFEQDYVRGIAQHELYIRDSADISGTEIIFKPDTAIFGDIIFSQDIINNWIKEHSEDIGNLDISMQRITE